MTMQQTTLLDDLNLGHLLINKLENFLKRCETHSQTMHVNCMPNMFAYVYIYNICK